MQTMENALWDTEKKRPRGGCLMRKHAFRSRAGVVAALVCAAAYPASIRAHHSTAEYDAATFVEARGEVVKVLWQNPHIRLEISTARFDGVSELWLLEGQNPTDLDRARILGLGRTALGAALEGLHLVRVHRLAACQSLHARKDTAPDDAGDQLRELARVLGLELLIEKVGDRVEARLWS